jgi:glycosyltransferase involved in cell wall biosynthesis
MIQPVNAESTLGVQLPTVTAVIPTRNRPKLVVRAIESALAQHLSEIEVVVVIDGPDQATINALESIKDPRVITIGLERPVGGGEARNIGVRAGRGEYIAFLDDDDEWSPNKLSLQLELARRATARYPFVTCRLFAHRPTGDEIWPLRPMKPGESMSEYLICREASIRQGEGFIQTSTLLIPRSLMLEVPFKPGLARHQDWDWLIRASVHSGVEFLSIWQPLVTYHIDAARRSVSSGRSTSASLEWIDNNDLITPKARAYFYATQIAARCDAPPIMRTVIRNTFRYPRAFAIAMGMALTPRSVVNLLRPRRTLAHA